MPEKIVQLNEEVIKGQIEYSGLREQPVRRLRATVPVARSQGSVARATKSYFWSP